jgi:DNA-binding Lrp family transcriptional regulator
MISRSKKVMGDVIAAMRSAGIRPEVIYAYERTGFLVDEEGYKKLSAEDRADYDAAIDEYLTKNG